MRRGQERRRSIAALGLVVALQMACGDASPPPEGAVAEPAHRQPERIVVVAPSAAEILFALGLGDRVVGVGDYVHWPDEVAALPRLGGLYDFRLERIVELDPTVAVLVTSEVALREKLVALGVEVVVVPSESLADVETAMRALAVRFGLADGGEAAVTRWWAMLEPRSAAAGASVLLTVGREPGNLSDIRAVGAGTFLDELLSRLGATNALADVALAYPQVSLDELLRRQPDVVLELRAESLSDAARAGAAADWRSVSAAWADDLCVASIEGDHVLLAGPRLPRLLAEMASALEGCLGG